MRTYLKNYSNVKRDKYLVYFLCLLLLFSGCHSGSRPSSGSGKQSVLKPPPATDDYFQEIGQEIGLDFINSIGEEHLNNIIEFNRLFYFGVM